MRILVVSNGFPPRGAYGTEFYTAELVRALQGRGHELFVLHPDRSGERPRYSIERVREGDVDVHLLSNAGDAGKRFEPSYWDPQVEQAFDRELAELRPDLVHFTYLLWGLSVRLPEVARKRGVPSVLTLTDYGLLCHRGQMYDWRLERCGGPHPADVCARCIRTPSRYDLAPGPRLVKRIAAAGLAAVGGLGRVVTAADLSQREERVHSALTGVDRFIAPTEVLGQAFESAGLGSPVRLTYAFDEEPYAAVRETAPPAEAVFGFLGQFGPHKGLATLIEASRLLEERRPNDAWTVRLHGGPAPRHARYAPEVLARAGARVTRGEPFGPEAAPAVLVQLSALCLPSEWDENAPLSILQARAAGVPVLASSVPGIAEVVEDGVHGRLFPVGDAQALSRAMEEILDGKLERGRDAGLPIGLEEHVAKLEAIYAEVTAESAS